MCQSLNFYFLNCSLECSDTKIIYGYNFAPPLIELKNIDLKTSNKRTQIPLLINLFFSLIERKGVRKIVPRSGSGFGLGLALELVLGAIFLGDNFPRTELKTSNKRIHV